MHESEGTMCQRGLLYKELFQINNKSQQSSFPQIGKQTKTEMEMLQMSSLRKR